MANAKRKRKPKSKLDTFIHHGADLVINGSQAEGDCLFCRKENHFYVNSKTGQWDCKACGKRGNVSTFLSQLHEVRLDGTTDDQYAELSSDRGGLAPAILRAHSIAFDPITGRYLIPVQNGSKGFTDLRTYTLGGKGVRSTSNCKVGLHRANLIQSSGPIYVCEGEWDAAALDHLLKRAKIEDPYSVVSVPGAGTFKEEWAKFFEGRDVILMYDHDDAGKDGMRRVIESLTPTANSIQKIEWQSSLPEGYDLRDYALANRKTPKRGLRELREMIVPSAGRPRQLLDRTTFKSVLDDFQSELHVTDNFSSALALSLATVISIRRFDSDPLWLFLVGPPGSGKTLLLQAFDDSSEEFCVFRSKLTATTLVSGWVGDGQDASMLPRLSGKTLAVKDYTAVLSMPSSTQEELYGLLRDAYDGSVRIQYGNQLEKHYTDCHFGILAGVTDEIHTSNRAALGERFIKYELIPQGYDPADQIRAAVAGVTRNTDYEQLLKDSISSYLTYKFQEDAPLPEVPSWTVNRIISLSQVISFLRAVVKRSQGDLAYRPRPEVGTRLAKQLCKLAQSLALVYDKDRVTPAIYRLVQQVALDTATGFPLEIVSYLMQSRLRALSKERLRKLMQISPASLGRKLNDLQEIGAVEFVTPKTKKQGRPANVWQPTKSIRDLWGKAKIEKYRVIQTPSTRMKREARIKR